MYDELSGFPFTSGREEEDKEEEEEDEEAENGQGRPLYICFPFSVKDEEEGRTTSFTAAAET